MAILARYEESDNGYERFKTATRELGLRIQVYDEDASSAGVGGPFHLMATDFNCSVIAQILITTKPATFDADFPKAVKCDTLSAGV